MSTKVLNILITGGRAPVALDLARNLQASGHKIYTADSIKANLCRYSKSVSKSFLVAKPNSDEKSFISDILQLIIEYDIDFLIPTCEETFYISKYKGQIEQSTNVKVFTDVFIKLKILHNKFEFIEKVKEFGLKFPTTYLLNSVEGLQNILNSKWDTKEKLVLKPTYSRFGTKVKIFNNKKGIDFKFDISQSNPWVIQKFIEGEQICTYSVCIEGEILAYSAYKSSFKSGIGASINFESVIDRDIFEWVTYIVKRLNYTGQISFDLIITEQREIYPIECNPRATSGIHLISMRHALEYAFLNKKQEPVLVKENEKAMLFLPMLLLGFFSIRKLSDINKWFKVIGTSKEVVYSTGDLLPFFYQIKSFVSLICIAIRKNISITEASTSDIEWNGDL